VASLPYALAAGVAVSFKGYIYLFGGLSRFGSGTYYSTVLKYDPIANTWTKTGVFERKREHLSATADDSLIYLVGGRIYGDDGFVTHPYVDAFNPETKEWTKLPDLPKSTSACGAGIVGNRLLAVTGEQLNGGGFTGHFLIPDSFAFDFQTWEWTKVSKCPTPKHGTQAVVIDGVFYFPGGGIMAYSYSSTNANNSFEF
jgi:N-acetylneuraminic acid mutarotase